MFFRIKARAGAKKAVLAVAHKVLVIAYSILKTKEPYRELGGDYFDKLNPERTAQRLMVRIAKLGFDVEIKRRPVPAVAPVVEAVSVVEVVVEEPVKKKRGRPRKSPPVGILNPEASTS